MKKNTRIAIVLAALTAVMAFASCGSSDSSSKADTSSAAAASAAENAADSTAAESTPAESTADTAESTSAESEGNPATEIDTAKLTATAWASAVMIKTDGTTPTVEEYAQEQGQTTEDMLTTICFGTDGSFVVVRQGVGAIFGTYTVNGKEVAVTLDNGVTSKFEMTERDGKTMLGEEETDKSTGIEGTFYGAYDKIVPDEYIASLKAGGEGAAEGGEGAAEGGEGAAEGGEGAAEGGEGAAEGGEGAAEGGEEAAE